jgi:hypothetical protein
MIKLKALLLETGWSDIIIDDKYTWYHGRSVDNDTFSLNYVGGEESTDQEGPGFYFTNNLQNAKGYAYPNGIVLKCKVDYKKLIIKGDVSETQTSKKIVIDLINNSPNKDSALENFDEDPKVAMIKAVNVYLKYTAAYDSYQIIARDFYRYNAKEYLQVLSKYYDAQLTKHDNTTYHLIVYNPNIITIIDKIKI